MSCQYLHPQIDQVPQRMLVDVTQLSTVQYQTITSIPEAVDLYLAVFGQQFTGSHGPARKQYYLYRFIAQLKAENHSMRLTDLTLNDGRQFLASLVNAYDGTPLSQYGLGRYKSALRTWSRYLFQSRLLTDDIFFHLTV